MFQTSDEKNLMGKLTEKELINILRTPSLKPNAKQVLSSYTEGAKRVCKAFSDAAFSARDFGRALTEVNRIITTKKKIR